MPRRTPLARLALAVVAALAFSSCSSGDDGDSPARPSTAPGAWADDDVRPEKAAGACESVRAETLELINVDPTLQPEYGGTLNSCKWYAVAGEDPALDVTIEVSKPTETASASEAAIVAADVMTLADEDYEEVEGIGDQAWVSRGHNVVAMAARPELVVRSGNVVVRASTREIWKDSAPADRPHLPPVQLEQAAHAAVREVLGHLDVDLPQPAQRDAGSVTRSLDTCSVAAGDADALLPGAEAEGTTYEPDTERQSACLWENEKFEQLVVETYAMPGDLTGRSASEEARWAFGSDDGGREIADLGDEAKVEVGHLIYRRAEVTVRHENLLIFVAYDREGVSDSDLMAGAERVARTVLAAYS